MDKKHEQFLQRAIDLACNNVRNSNGGPYGAVIVKKGGIIAESGNRVTIDLDPTAHAEILTIRLACKASNDFRLIGCTLYSSCEPCPMCLGAIYWARLEKVYFACDRQDAAQAGFDDHFIYEEILLHPEKRHIPMLQIERPNAQKPFLDWNAKKGMSY
ncbi:MAG: nucleoside deaminase [Methylococcaceae bacterium]|nr:nucleoside deaminase [Methylococcaceae bacterium]